MRGSRLLVLVFLLAGTAWGPAPALAQATAHRLARLIDAPGWTDASPSSRYGAIDVGLSWPGRYSHSPVEVIEQRDFDSVIRLVVAIATSV